MGTSFNEGAKPLLLHWHWLLGKWAGDSAHSEEQMVDMGRQVGIMALHGDHNMARDGACERQRA